MITRQQYMDNENHREYYAQFVNEDTKNSVLRGIGKQALLKSTDEHLNDIKLYKWDSLYIEYNRDVFKTCDTYGMTMATWVCIAKEAGRQIIEANK
jgi:hypothetical protein